MGDVVDLNTELLKRLLSEFQEFRGEMRDFRSETLARFAGVDARFALVDARLADVNARLDAVNGRLDHLVDFFDTQWRSHDRRLHKVERDVDTLKGPST